MQPEYLDIDYSRTFKRIEMPTLFEEKVKTKETERGELLRFFVENIKNKKGKPYTFPFMAMKLSHLELQDLYFFVSACKDRLNRNGQATMSKYFWWSLKSK